METIDDTNAFNFYALTSIIITVNKYIVKKNYFLNHEPKYTNFRQHPKSPLLNCWWLTEVPYRFKPAFFAQNFKNFSHAMRKRYFRHLKLLLFMRGEIPARGDIGSPRDLPLLVIFNLGWHSRMVFLMTFHTFLGKSNKQICITHGWPLPPAWSTESVLTTNYACSCTYSNQL